MPALYTKISQANHDYLAVMAQASGLSMSAVINALTDEARRRGWAIDPAPGITIRDRLRVLLPNDPNSYYRERELVPTGMLGGGVQRTGQQFARLLDIDVD